MVCGALGLDLSEQRVAVQSRVPRERPARDEREGEGGARGLRGARKGRLRRWTGVKRVRVMERGRDGESAVSECAAASVGVQVVSPIS